MLKNVKKVKIVIPNQLSLKMAKTIPTFSRLSRLELVVGENIETVNHKQFSDMIRLYPQINIEVEEI